MQSLKSIFITLLVLGGVFLAYDYYLAPDKEQMVFKRPATALKPEAAAGTSATPAGPAGSVAPPVAAGMPSNGTPESVRGASASMTPVPAPASQGKSTDGFVPPAIASVEQSTGNWTRIPARAFPRQVKLLQAIALKASFGGTQMAAGSEVTVLAAENGMLTVAPTPSSEMRGTVPIDGTDLKATLTTTYNLWREQRIAEVRSDWEERGRRPAPSASSATLTSADGKPQASPDGTFPLLLASMRSGMVTEVTPKSITHWGSAEAVQLGGKRCWMIPVDYDAKTAFGTISTTAVAKVVDGRVAGWFYKGSGEPVP